MSLRPRCYVASPLGFTEAGRTYYTEVLLPALATVVEPIDPWALSTAAEVADALAAGSGRDMWLELGRRNARAINSSEVLVAFLEGQELDSGTVAELGYAAALGKRCYGLRSDLRQAGESGMAVNLQVEALVIGSGGLIADTLAALVEALTAYPAAIAPDGLG
jgi:nucleoside 2-deoxyribosyltransferase